MGTAACEPWQDSSEEPEWAPPLVASAAARSGVARQPLDRPVELVSPDCDAARADAARAIAGGGGGPSDGDPGRERGWNVLARQLVAFPPGPSVVDVTAPEDRGTRREVARGPADPGDVDRRRAEEWLGRELTRLRTLADQAYPEAPSLDRRSAASRLEVRELSVAAGAPKRAQPRPARRARTARALPSPQPARASVPRRRLVTGAELRGLRRLLPGVATLAVLAGLWFGVAALAQANRPQPAAFPGTVRTASGLVYIVRPGDTLWSIALRLEPSGDPRPIVAELQQQLHGAPLLPGDRLRLP